MFYLIWYGLVTLDFTGRILKSLPHFRLLSILWPALQAGKEKKENSAVGCGTLISGTKLCAFYFMYD